jgi:hypothetical protein
MKQKIIQKYICKTLSWDMEVEMGNANHLYRKNSHSQSKSHRREVSVLNYTNRKAAIYK